ncbi:helix-turn-helix domain-containing protein [Amycolatopsis sp. lyj-346]|uniref:helix-turn-helix domain-containing protein n=1 Tax=Amycolatopsis sp. lyj-346 TaxID=2789289 RepID=UPI003979F94B
MTDAAPLPALIVLASGLREARTRRGIKLRRLADMLDLHPGVLSAFELGRRTPPATTVAHILGVLRSPNTVRDHLVDLAAGLTNATSSTTPDTTKTCCAPRTNSGRPT